MLGCSGRLIHQSQIAAPCQYRLHYVGGGGETVLDGESGVLLLLVEQQGIEQQTDAAGGGEGDGAAVRVVVREARSQLFGCLRLLAGKVEQHQPARSELQLTGLAQQQGAKFGLETRDMLTDGGLSEIQPLGGAGKTAGFMHHHQGVEPEWINHKFNLCLQLV